MEMIYSLFETKNGIVLTYGEFIFALIVLFFGFSFLIGLVLLPFSIRKNFDSNYIVNGIIISFIFCFFLFLYLAAEKPTDFIVFSLKKHFLEEQYMEYKVYQAKKKNKLKLKEEERIKKRIKEKEDRENTKRKKELEAKIQERLKEKGLTK